MKECDLFPQKTTCNSLVVTVGFKNGNSFHSGEHLVGTITKPFIVNIVPKPFDKWLVGLFYNTMKRLLNIF